MLSIAHSNWLDPKSIAHTNWLNLQSIAHTNWLDPQLIAHANWLDPQSTPKISLNMLWRMGIINWSTHL